MLNHCVNTRRRLRRQRRGAMMMLMVLCIPVVLMFSAFAINVAWMQLTRTELRTATDAAVRAGSRTLSLTQDPDLARSAAIDAASRNTVAGNGLIVAPGDVEFGLSEQTASGKWKFSPKKDTSKDLTGVRVTGSRDSSSGSGAIPMLFAGVFDRGSFEPVKTATASQLDRDVFLVLDRSGSMASSTPGGNRWVDLKRAVLAFLTTLRDTPQDELVGVVSYSTSSTLDDDMTLRYGDLMRTINGKTVGGMTAIGYGLEDGISGVLNPALTRPNAAKTIVLMTDGIHNTGTDPEIVARTAQDTYGITVHTITFSSGANQQHMKNVASAGGGKHWHADDQAQLIQVFIEVANNLPTLITE